MKNTLLDDEQLKAYKEGYDDAQQEWVKERSILDERIDNQMQCIQAMEKRYASIDRRYFALFEQWREAVQSEAQLKRLYSNLLEDWYSLLAGKVIHRRRILDTSSLSTPNEELVS